ncbi:glycoside hydrolase family 2 protein [Streptomonospora sp. S1-112]|uniref:beta-mannosidase n=1 Tax=Streptomonospora mangrovi TaxID=2883123 RepID=A0A9X3NLC1_9ACTN|nr:glycoside hydrolase family 2 protein [Streptomonospora mangrovi]MDA0565607.1 glycoside hydrolase family 2 protein [Streptomonospora mangrovi]
MLIDLTEGWSVRAAGGDAVPAEVAGRALPAAVPGCVHTDLMAAGLIPDPYAGTNEERLHWIGRTDWTYRLRFDAAFAAGAERVDLVCDGLDTVARVLLNGTEVGRARNQHRRHRFDLRPALRGNGNELEVAFSAPYPHAEGVRADLGERPGAYTAPYQFIRKTACDFGWDWGPALVTSGIWRPVAVHAWSTARLAAARPEVTVERGARGPEGVVRVHVAVERAGEAPGGAAGTGGGLVAAVEVAGVRAEAVLAPGQDEAVVEARVPDCALWWPRGYGDQPLYDLAVTLTAAGGAGATVLDSRTMRIGFRTVALDTAPDEHGSAFVVRVNDRPVQVRGANWIPDDCFANRVTPQRYRTRVDQAVAANVNLLRVWGGGRYESAEFYRVCDELGVLVWQDFLFACAAYPEEEPLAGEVAAEARDAVDRLAPHPSLVLWNGNNECLEGFEDWGWQEPLAGRSWGAGFYHRVLPAIVAELDPTRPYIPGSPHSPGGARANDPGHGTTHMWDVWNRLDYTAYRTHRPRFAAEFGFQGPATHATLRSALEEADMRADSPAMLHHQRADDGHAKLLAAYTAHFGPVPPDQSHDDWHYLTQLNQARAVALGVEHLRSLWPLCAGTVVWQLNDCWPVISWSAVDGQGRRKPMWYALRRAYRERLLSVQPERVGESGEPEGGGLVVAAVNDTDEPWEGACAVVRRGLDGRALAEAVLELRVPARGAARLAVPEAVALPGEAGAELLTAQAGGDRAWWFYARDHEIAYPEPKFTAAAAPRGEDLEVTVTADVLLRDVALFADRLGADAEADDMLVTLLPGEAHTFTVAGGAGLDTSAAVRAPVLRCVNDVLAAGARTAAG